MIDFKMVTYSFQANANHNEKKPKIRDQLGRPKPRKSAVAAILRSRNVEIRMPKTIPSPVWECYRG